MNKPIVVLSIVAVVAVTWWSQSHQWQTPSTDNAQVDSQQLRLQETKAAGPSAQLSRKQRDDIAKALSADDSQQVPHEVLEQLPLSLRGAPLPAPLAVHEDGTLVINIAVRQYFDFFLTAIGEEPLSLIASRVRHQLSNHLQDPALSEALAIFASYLAYRDDLAQVLHQGEQDYQTLRVQIHATRDSHFDAPVIEAFFAQEDSYDAFMHARSQINNDDSLTLEQKRQRSEQLLASAPSWLQAQHQQANQLNSFYQAQAKLQAIGAKEDDIQQLRELSFGPEAADRLAALAQKRKIWQQKVENYHVKVQALLDSSLDKQVLKDEIEQLRQSEFSDAELLRVQAIDSRKFAGLVD